MTVNLFNKSGAIHIVTAQGIKDVKWHPQTLKTFSEEEAEKLLRYDYVVEESDLLKGGSASILIEKDKEIEALKKQLSKFAKVKEDKEDKKDKKE
jgi:hypothetical protein